VSSTAVNPSSRERCSKVLREVSAAHCILPQSCFPPGVTLNGTTPYASGGFADIWKGQEGGNQVRVKAFRTLPHTDRIKRVCCVPISTGGGAQLGCYPSSEFQRHCSSFACISPWLPNGRIIDHTRENQRVNRLHLVSTIIPLTVEPPENSSLVARINCLWS